MERWSWDNCKVAEAVVLTAALAATARWWSCQTSSSGEELQKPEPWMNVPTGQKRPTFSCHGHLRSLCRSQLFSQAAATDAVGMPCLYLCGCVQTSGNHEPTFTPKLNFLCHVLPIPNMAMESPPFILVIFPLEPPFIGGYSHCHVSLREGVIKKSVGSPAHKKLMSSRLDLCTGGCRVL